MRTINRFWLLAAFCALVTVCPVTAQDTGTATADETKKEEVKIPESTDMTLGVKDSPVTLPENFRGKEAEEGDLQWLEDVGVLMQENSNLYNVDAAAIAEAAKFSSEPNITWEVKKEDDSGNLETESTDNTNKATNPCNITDPGYYQVHNGGARQVSTAGGAEEDTDAVGQPSDETNKDDEGSAEGETKTVTAQQRIGIEVHDCTSPDVWVAFQEGAGTVDMAASEAELKETMAGKIVETKGRPFSVKTQDYETASYLFIDEGQDEERNRIPWEKTARLSIAGTLFNERGAPKFESGVLTAKIDQADYRNHVNVVGGEEKNLKGVYVRRNVPFIFAAMSTDNGNKRATTGLVTAAIETADGKEIDKDGASYMFRVPNYPRSQYPDEPDYFFTTNATDKDGNVTTVRMPLYVVETSAAFEGGKNN
ncbi:MAG TPA: hypothetical protein PLM07_06765 [Candidatus Rifleibacterium sp.]|nr:hypothetical protein [Candidatus Rifleibacterium sp.]